MSQKLKLIEKKNCEFNNLINTLTYQKAENSQCYQDSSLAGKPLLPFLGLRDSTNCFDLYKCGV
jgi:hypothetical protein